MAKSNLVLIGMPGAGKSTVGVLLAKTLGMDFVDTDILIQRAEGRTLQDIIDLDGYLALRRVENEVIRRLQVKNCVIATGGSAVYNEQAMHHLAEDGIIIYLQASLQDIESRINDKSTRGIAKRPDQSFEDLYEERTHLYRRYANITTPTHNLSHEQVCENIISAIQELQEP